MHCISSRTCTIVQCHTRCVVIRYAYVAIPTTWWMQIYWFLKLPEIDSLERLIELNVLSSIISWMSPPKYTVVRRTPSQQIQKHLYNTSTMLYQHRRPWVDLVKMLYKFQIQINIHLFMFQLQCLHMLKYIYIFDNRYKGDPQKALLKAASMRATLKCGAWCFWNAAYATGEVQRRVSRTTNNLKIRHRVKGNASTWDDVLCLLG